MFPPFTLAQPQLKFKRKKGVWLRETHSTETVKHLLGYFLNMDGEKSYRNYASSGLREKWALSESIEEMSIIDLDKELLVTRFKNYLHCFYFVVCPKKPIMGLKGKKMIPK